MNNLENKKQEMSSLKKSIFKCSERIVTLKLAVKGLLGNISEYVLDKLIEIAGEINTEQSLIELYEHHIKCLEDEQYE